MHAAIAGWTHPLSREGFHQIDIMDLLIAHWTKQGKTPFQFPRPSDAAVKRARSARVTDPERLEKFKVKWREPR